ncbi:MAG: FliM/FliN family flagellar motor switch protein [Arenicella sp.]
MNIVATQENKTIWKKFKPAKIGGRSLSLGNSLSSLVYYPIKDDEGFLYRLNLLKEVPKNYVAISVGVVVGGFGFSIHLDRGAADVLLKEMIPEQFISNVPTLLFKALFFKRFNQVFKSIESEFAYEIKVVSFTVSDGKKRVRKGGFCWDVLHQGTMKGELWVSSKKVSGTFLEKFFFTITNDFSPPFFDQLPVLLSIVLGHLRFTRKEFLEVEEGDVLILDKHSVQDKALLLGKLNISPGFQAAVSIDEKQVVVKQTLERIVNKPSKNNEGKINLEDVELDITFEYAKSCISFSELKKVGPGYVITLDREAAETIDILANGRCVGVGEIVQVGSRTGIRVLELYEGEHDGSR